MINIDNTQYKNTIVATLREMQCTTTKTFLLRLKNIMTGQFYRTVVNDISPAPVRYQEFEVIMVSGSTNPLASQLSIPLEGQYLYEFFENPASGTTEAGLNVVEVGRALVTGCKPVSNQYQQATYPKYSVYEEDAYICYPPAPPVDEGVFSTQFNSVFA